jgi:hypothetical protein
VTDRETFRLAPPVALWWAWLAFVAANVADYAVQGLPSARFGALVAAVLLQVTGLAYTLALRPRVIASGDGITVLNPFRTHVVPWRLVTAVDTGDWVRVRYAPLAAGPDAQGGAGGRAGGKAVDCWALYVSARARRTIAAGQRRNAAAPASASASSRLPEEARYLASLPPAKAMAVRLDARAGRERALTPGDGGQPPLATARWSWPALTAGAIPALVLICVVLA